MAYIAILLRCNLIVPKPDGMLPVCLQQTSTRKTRDVPSDCVLERVWDSAVNKKGGKKKKVRSIEWLDSNEAGPQKLVRTK